MKKKFQLLAFVAAAFLFYSAGAAAQTWGDAVVAAKKNYTTSLKEASLPVASKVMHKGDAPEKITVDVTGLDELVLYSDGTEDGTNYDHALWGDAKFIAPDGSVTYLDKMSFKYAKSDYDIKRNKTFGDDDPAIGDKKYEHSVLLHSEGEIVVVLDKKYKTFEAEVGIEHNATNDASVIFKVQNVSARDFAEKMYQEYPQETGAFLESAGMSVAQWLSSTDGSIEKKAALNLAKKLKDPAYFTEQINNLSGSADDQIKGALKLFNAVYDVLNVQDEIAWINPKNVRRAFEDFKNTPGYDAATYEAKLKELETLFAGNMSDIYKNDATALANAQKAVALSREILVSNPALDVDKIIIGRFKLKNARRDMAPSLGTQNNNWSNQMSAARRGFDAEIAEMSNLRGDSIHFRTIYKPADKVTVSDLHLNWDGERIMFTSINDRGLWGVFEVKRDGSGLRELIKMEDDPDLEFFDGAYLPNGKIMAVSNIGYNGVPCVSGSDPVGNMVLFDPKDGNLRRITYDQDANWHPVTMNNGKVMYVRWEYTDLTHYFSRIVMHMNPDGTEQKSLYGSGGFFPNSTFDVQPLPGNGSRFIGVISGHHGIARSGRLMLFDPAKSRKKTEGIVQEIPFSTRPIDPIIKDQLVDGVWPQFLKPFPVTDKYFLVTAKLSPQSLWGIYLVDIYDNMTLICENEGEGLMTPILAKSRPVPPVIPDRVNLKDSTAVVFIQDIYEGEGLPGVPRGTVKELRIFAYEYAYIKSPSDHTAQGIQSGWDIKRLLGTVPIEEDGSVKFRIPANTPISIQPLDSEGRAIQWMRSWLTGMPGETVSCVGCHEDQNKIALPKNTIASSTTEVKEIQAPEGGVHSVNFEMDIQPILDRACVACHNEKSSLNFKKGNMDEEVGLSKSYLAFHPYVNRQGPEADALVMRPYEYHASTSELIRILKNDHHGVKLTDKEWRAIYTWIDMNAPYRGSFVQRDLKGYNQIDRRRELSEKYGKVFVDWEQELRDYAKYLESKGEITPVMPEETPAPKYKEVKVKGWPMNNAASAVSSDDVKKIEVAPGITMTFRRIPAGTFVMGNNNYGKQCAPETKVKIAKDFWMGEMEVSNEQFCALFPEHDSRYIAQMWKDHTGPGYAANKPKQSVIRVSWNEAMDFCQKLSEQTGLKITLPTEAQWEWACRAGSDTDFWFGTKNDDFGKYENLADVSLEKMAVSGVDPKPMSKNNFWFKYYNFLPKIESVNDGTMLLAEGGQYQANPWGLYDMHGNVEEWTRSDYVPYPYSEKGKVTAEEKTVRGGSWISRPKEATSYYRKGYLPWQKPNNVGFRVIIEDAE